MKKTIGLTIVAFLTLLILIFISNPSLLDKVWMWGIGLAGYLIALVENGYKSLKSAFESKKDPQLAKQIYANPNSLQQSEEIQLELKRIRNRVLQIENKLKEVRVLESSA